MFTDPYTIALLVALLFASALYASVGHGGASAYLAVMGIAGFVPAEMKPIALCLNISVSFMAMLAFHRAGHFRKNLFIPLVITSIPAAFIGGWLQLPDSIFKWILAASLIFAACRLIFHPTSDETKIHTPNTPTLLGIGVVIGLLSGLIGIGGGIFLTPLLILFHWSNAKTAAAISAAFIFVNSISGLTGFLTHGGLIPTQTWFMLPAVIIGGILGATWGSQHAKIPLLQKALAIVLVIAAGKFLVV